MSSDPKSLEAKRFEASSSDPAGWFPRLAVTPALIVLLITLLDLIGWLFHMPLLTSVRAGYATMKPNTALSLALLATAILLQRKTPVNRLLRVLALIAALAAFTISGLTLAEYVAHLDLGIDQLLIAVPPDRFRGPAGRMSLGTSTCLCILSLALLAIDAMPFLSVAMLLLGGILSVASLIGFLFDAGPLAGVPWLRSLAINTGSALFLLQAAALAARPNLEPLFTLNQSWRREGRRRLLLFGVTVLPVAVALPILIGMRAQLFDPAFALALLLVLLIVSQTTLLWEDSRALERLETSLRASELRSSRILESIGDAVIVTDAQTLVQRLNPVAEQLTGWSSAEALGQPLADVFRVINESTRLRAENPADKVRDLGIIVGLANRTLLIGKEGAEIPIDDSAAPIRDDTGALSGIVLVFRDISARLETERALLQGEKLAAVGRLAATIAHEINNPLESVTNLLYLARTSDGIPPAVQEFLNLADEELRRASTITSHTLRFHKQSTKPCLVKAEDLFGDVLSLYSSRAAMAHVTVEQRQRTVPAVLCFEGEVRQVLNNLIGNAIDAMTPTGGRLLLRTRQGTDWASHRAGLVLTIADTGRGISPQNLAKIYEPFFTTKGIGGNGLGLWISQEIIARHHGLLRVRSSQRPPHTGTAFSLFLPFDAPDRLN